MKAVRILFALLALALSASAQAQVYAQTATISQFETDHGNTKVYLTGIASMCANGSGPSYSLLQEADTGWKSTYSNLLAASVSGQVVTVFSTYVGGGCRVDSVKKFP